MHTNLHTGQWCSPVLGVEALMFPFTALQKINCFHAALCPGGQGLHRAHNDTVQPAPRAQCTDEGLHCSAPSCSAAPGLAGREGWHCLQCPGALSQHQPAPCLCQQAWPQRSARAAPRRGHITAHTSRTGNQTQPRAQCLIRVSLAESSPSALATPELAARPGR